MEKQRVNEAKVRPMSPADMVNAIRTEAIANPCLNAVCHIFAIRERARQQVTLSTLMLTTKAEGYNFSKEDHEAVLTFLAKLGLGKLETDGKGRIVALKGISVTLQSIGLAGISKMDTLNRFEPQHTFKPLTSEMQKAQPIAAQAVPLKTKAPTPVEAPKTKAEELFKAALTLSIGGKPVEFELPKVETPEQLGQLLVGLFSKK